MTDYAYCRGLDVIEPPVDFQTSTSCSRRSADLIPIATLFRRAITWRGPILLRETPETSSKALPTKTCSFDNCSGANGARPVPMTWDGPAFWRCGLTGESARRLRHFCKESAEFQTAPMG